MKKRYRILALLLAAALLAGCAPQGAPAEPAEEQPAPAPEQPEPAQQPEPAEEPEAPAPEPAEEQPAALDDVLARDESPAVEWTAHIRANFDGPLTDEAAREEARSIMEIASSREEEVSFYNINLPGQEAGTQRVRFFNGNDAVAYMEMDDLFALYSSVVSPWAIGADYSLDTEYTDRAFIAERESGASVYIDFIDGYALYTSYDGFASLPAAVNGGDILTVPVWQTDAKGNLKTGEDGELLAFLFGRDDFEQSFTRQGSPLVVAIAGNHIPIFWEDGKGYMPVTTFGDLFLSGRNFTLIYNGRDLFLTSLTGFNDTVPYPDGRTMKEIAFDVPWDERSQELAEYTYREIVLNLEGNYGLREIHNIGDDFDVYLETVGLKDRLLSQDGVVFSDALAELAWNYFGDIHSVFGAGGFYAGEDYAYEITPETANLSEAVRNTLDMGFYYTLTRAQFDYLDEYGRPIPYLEIGNTAFVTFDGFALSLAVDYYDPEQYEQISADLASDTISLIHYANERITREGSPIENVVIDLSNNLGGAIDAAAFVGAWVLGSFPYSTVNALSGAQYTVHYTADVNLDGKIDETDHLDLTQYNVFCLTSPKSFSCGNLIPAVFKADGRVTLVGRKSGGGACVVQNAMTADGTTYQFSGPVRMSNVSNGSYYDIDQGVDVDVSINKPEHFYDRVWLANYINQIP